MKIKTLSLLIILVLFHITNNGIVLYQDKGVPVYDRAQHTLNSHEIYKNYKIVSSHGLQKAYSYFCNVGGGRYPPFFYFTSAPLFYLVELNFDFALYANILYLFILIFSVYGIGKNLYDSKVGVLSAFVVSMFPGIFAFSRVAFLDFPLTAMVTLSIFLLLSTEHFRKRWLSFLFGLSVGLGMLTKWSFIVYVIGALVYYGFISVKDDPMDRRKRLLNISLALFTAFIVSAPWYIPDTIKLIKNILLISMWEAANPDAPILFHLLFYIRSLHLYQIFPFLLLLFTPLFFRHLIRKKWVIVLWLIVPFIVFTALTNKDPRYTMPMLPAIGIIIASETAQLRKGILVALCSFLLFQFFLLSYLPQSIFNDINIETNPVRLDLKYVDYKGSGPLFETGMLYPDRRGSIWRENSYEMVRIFKRHLRRGGRYPTGLFIFNIGEIIYSPLFVIAQEDLSLEFHSPCVSDIVSAEDYRDPDYTQYVLEHDFVITKNGYRGFSAPGCNLIDRLIGAFEENKNKFNLIGTLKHEDNSEIYIYKRIQRHEY